MVAPEVMNAGELSREKKALQKELNAMTFSRQVTSPAGPQPSFVREEERALVERMAAVSAALHCLATDLAAQRQLLHDRVRMVACEFDSRHHSCFGKFSWKTFQGVLTCTPVVLGYFLFV